MRWLPGGRSADVEDRRGERVQGGGMGFPGMSIGLGGIAVLVVLSLLTGQNFLALLVPDVVTTEVNDRASPAPYRSTPAEDRLVEFVSFVLDDAQATWTRVLPEETGRPYRRAKLVLFTDAVRSACGYAESAMGPFYCQVDEKVYIDLGFYRELRSRFGAGGDFAQAYVVAHEIGHHVQRVLGIADRVRAAVEQDPDRANAISVRTELQADCFAGVWGHSTQERNVLEEGDVEEGLGAAAAIGDDRIQRGGSSPETWTHGSSRQRVGWFRRGLETGRVDACDTFATRLPGE